MTAISKCTLQKLIQESLDELYSKDKYLIDHTPQDWINYQGDTEGIKNGYVGERAIVFRFGLYLWGKIQEHDNLKIYNLDCEYNRNFYDTKNFIGFENGTYPDLIIHKRGSNENNIIVIEFKTWWNRNTTKDIEKIKGLMDSGNIYKYQFGLSIILEKKREDCYLNWILAV